MYDYECELGAIGNIDCKRDYDKNDCLKAIFEAIDLQFSRINVSQEYFDQIDNLPKEIKDKYHYIRIQKIDNNIYYQGYGIESGHIKFRFKHVLDELKSKEISDLDLIAVLYDENHHTTAKNDEIFYSAPIWTVGYNLQDMTSASQNNMILFPDGWVADIDPRTYASYKDKVKYFQADKELQNFDTKKDIAVFRGAANINSWQNQLSIHHINDHPRLKIPVLGALFPDHLDSKVDGIHSKVTKHGGPDAAKLGKMLDDLYNGEKFNFLGYQDQNKYKYIVSLDGNGAAWTRPLYISFSSSLLLYQTDYVQWFQPALQQDIHYLPVERDLSNLLEQINWAKENESEVIEMIKNANIVANKCFTPAAIKEHLRYILKQYANKFTYKIQNKHFSKI